MADASNPAALEQIAAVYEVLEELGIREKDTLLVLNQIDAIRRAGHARDRSSSVIRSAIPVSARTGEGLSRLAAAVSDALTQHFLDVDIETDVANGRLLAYLAKHGEILSRTYADDRVSVHCRMPRKFLGQIPPQEARHSHARPMAVPMETESRPPTAMDGRTAMRHEWSRFERQQRPSPRNDLVHIDLSGFDGKSAWTPRPAMCYGRQCPPYALPTQDGSAIYRRMAHATLTDRRALVTGASSGIGRALAIELARHGVDLVLLRGAKTGWRKWPARFASSAGGPSAVAGDVTDPAVRQRALDAARDELGGLDILVNNAGVAAHGRFADADPGRLRPIMEVNFFAAVELIREALPLLREGVQPIVVNIGSILGHRGAPHKSEYSASKFALHGFSEAVRPELATAGHRRAGRRRRARPKPSTSTRCSKNTAKCPGATRAASRPTKWPAQSSARSSAAGTKSSPAGAAGCGCCSTVWPRDRRSNYGPVRLAASSIQLRTFSIASMNATQLRAHRRENHLQSIILILGIALIMGVVGYVLWGRTGVWLALMVSAVSALVSPAISPRMILRMYQARPLEPRHAPSCIPCSMSW